MAGRDGHILLGSMVLLAGALGQRVNYPGPVCGVKGSTVTLPCTFSALKSVKDEDGEVLIEVRRVIWCRNHAHCHGVTPSVYDSDSERNDPRYRYLGDKRGSCSLQISALQPRDEATLRFRVEANDRRAAFTGQRGVRVTVSDGDPMQIQNSSEPDGAASLLCSARCTFHQLEVAWSRDGHALPQSGPAVRLGALTAKDSGNYTCALKNDPRTESLPYSLHVEAADGGPLDPLLLVRLVLFTLHTVLILTVAAILIRRMWAWKKLEAPEPPADFLQEL